MSNVWVCKFDGTIQCEPDSKEITLEEMRKQLATLIGEKNILNMEKRSRMMVTLCGMPTGSMNAYEITEEGWFLLDRGIMGRQGFNPCSGENVEDTEANIGKIISELTSSNPTTIKELAGRMLRVYKTGDVLTKDWLPERVNIETDERSVIVQIWFG